MREIDLFESWINTLSEGTVLPTTTQKQQQLIQLLSQPFPVGADATNAVETLHDLFMDPELSSDLSDLAETDPNADARPVIMSKLSDYKNQPGIATVMAKISNATANGEQPTDNAPPGGEEAVDATATPGATAPAPTAPAPETPAAPAQPQGGEVPAEEPVPDEMAPQPVAEEEEDFDYDADLKTILKHAGVAPCGCPAEDYITGKDPHLKESRHPFEVGESIQGYGAALAGGEAGAELGAAAGTAFGPVGTVVGGALGGLGGAYLGQQGVEQISKSAPVQQARKWVADKAGQVTGALGGGTGAQMLAKNVTDYALSPDEDPNVPKAVTNKTAQQGLDLLSKIPGVGKKVAKVADVALNANTLMNYFSKAKEVGMPAMKAAEVISAHPEATKIASDLLAKGVQDPTTRNALLGLTATGVAGVAAKGGVKNAANFAKDAVGGVKDAAAGAVGTAKTAAKAVAKPAKKFGSSFSQGFQAGTQGRGLPVNATQKTQQPTTVQPKQVAATPTQPAPTTQPDSGLAKTATLPQGHSSVLSKDQTVTPSAKRPLPKRASKPMRSNKKFREDITDEDAVVGKSLGSIGGGALGSTLAGPLGGVIGSKLGSMAGEKLGGHIAKKTGRGRTEVPDEKKSFAHHASSALGGLLGADIADIADAWHLSANTGSEIGSKAGEKIGSKLRGMLGRRPEPDFSPALAESINKDITRLQFLAGIESNKNNKN